jgi:hypothetical protein
MEGVPRLGRRRVMSLAWAPNPDRERGLDVVSFPPPTASSGALFQAALQAPSAANTAAQIQMSVRFGIVSWTDENLIRRYVYVSPSLPLSRCLHLHRDTSYQRQVLSNVG